MKRVIIILIALTLCAVLFVSCGKNNKNKNSDPDTGSEITEVDKTEKSSSDKKNNKKKKAVTTDGNNGSAPESAAASGNNSGSNNGNNINTSSSNGNGSGSASSTQPSASSGEVNTTPVDPYVPAQTEAAETTSVYNEPVTRATQPKETTPPEPVTTETRATDDPDQTTPVVLIDPYELIVPN